MAWTGGGRAFPEGFTWGTATAAHQVEGGNTNNDWWAFEHAPDRGAPSRRATPATRGTAGRRMSDLVAGLGFDNHRFSVEWSRIEPAEGEFSRAALAHYHRQCVGLRERGIDPVVTFHHFTTPIWLTAQGGWESDLAVERFGRFCEVVAEALGGVMARACTINEPNIVATMGWHAGMFPPGKSDVALSRTVSARLADAHRVAVVAIRANAPGVPVGLTLSMTDYQPAAGGQEKLESIRHHAEDVFLDAVEGDDFVGVQVYTRMLIGPDGWAGYEDGVPVLDMGYEFYPASLGNCLRRAWDYTGGSIPCSSPRTGSGRRTTNSASTTCARRWAVFSMPSRTAWTCGATPTGRCSTTSNGRSATGPASALSASTAATFARTAKPSAAWLAAVAAANAVDARFRRRRAPCWRRWRR